MDDPLDAVAGNVSSLVVHVRSLKGDDPLDAVAGNVSSLVVHCEVP